MIFTSPCVESPPLHCAVLENIHTNPTEGQWKFLGGRGWQKQIFYKEKNRAKFESPEGGRVQTKTLAMRGEWIFCGTMHFKDICE